MTLDLRFAGECVRLECDDGEFVRRVTALLHPSFAAGAPDASDPTVTVTLRPRDFAPPRLDYDRPWRLPALLAIDEDSGPRFRILRRDAHGADLVCEAQLDSNAARVLVGEDRRHWTLETTHGDARDVRIVARLLKYLVGCLVVARGCAVLHAAAVESEGRTILLCGPKGGGKTTTMFAACAFAGAGFVSDDLVVCWADGAGRFVCSGFPRRIAVPHQVLLDPRVPRAIDRTPLRREPLEGRATRAFTAEHRAPEGRRRLMMDLDEFLAVFGVRAAPPGPPAAVVRLRFDPELDGEWRIGAGVTVDRTELYAEEKHLKLFTDYLSLAPVPRGPRCEPPFDAAIERVPVLLLEHGPGCARRFEAMWDDVLRRV